MTTRMSRDDLIKVLQANSHDKPLSRKEFREDLGILDSEWTHHFGTWAEFKRAAGLQLSRDANQLALHVGKHASRDNQDKFNAEKRGYEHKYARDFVGRFKTVVVGSDFHDKELDPFVRRVFIDTCKRIQPEAIVLNGDIFDLPEFGKYSVDPRTWDVVGRIKVVHTFLKELREACPNSMIVFIEGNHEFRLIRHLSEATPALQAVLSDLHGFDVSKLLGIDAFELVYVGKADLRAWNNKDVEKELHANTYLLWDSLLADHFPTGAEQGIPGWNGHHHKLKISPLYSRVFGASQWVQLPAGHVANASYTDGEKWNSGFLIVHNDAVTKHSVFEPVEVRDFCVVGGKFYYRQADEVWHRGQQSFAPAE